MNIVRALGAGLLACGLAGLLWLRWNGRAPAQKT